jgi:hypothetical protein
MAEEFEFEIHKRGNYPRGIVRFAHDAECQHEQGIVFIDGSKTVVTTFVNEDEEVRRGNPRGISRICSDDPI